MDLLMVGVLIVGAVLGHLTGARGKKNAVNRAAVEARAVAGAECMKALDAQDQGFQEFLRASKAARVDPLGK